MIKVEAVWDGAAFVPRDAKEVDLRPNTGVRLAVTLPRSRSQHGLLFACIAKAFDNWPEDHHFQPFDEEQLRFWLEIRAGWGQSIEIKCPHRALKYMSAHWKDNMWAEELEEGFLIHRAKSIAYGKMQKGDFQELVSRIDGVLKAEVGFSISDLKLSLIEDAQ